MLSGGWGGGGSGGGEQRGDEYSGGGSVGDELLATNLAANPVMNVELRRFGDVAF